jgi:hypothetical protein
MHCHSRRYDETKLDDNGHPTEPIAFWVKGEEWRAASFDEMRLDDTTHGAGGDRKGRTEASVRCGPWDIGECVGQKSASHTASMAGGSNAIGEPVPPWFSLAANSDPDDAIFAMGPVAIVNGHRLPSRGASNPKGSVDGKHAILMLFASLVAMFDAHGGLRADRRAVVACDGVGTHMTAEFFKACREAHIVMVLRTPWCSNRIQFEDLVSFWQLKNAKDVGWYKIKMKAVGEKIALTGSAALTHAEQLALLVPSWNEAFAKETNLRAWRKGGFALDGIRLTPLWDQKKKDSCSSLHDRALSKAELRQGAIQKLGLNNTYQFDRVLAWGSRKRTADELTAEAHATAANTQEDDAEYSSSTTRSFVCEQQRLRVPATSDPGTKLKMFHDQVVELSTLHSAYQRFLDSASPPVLLDTCVTLLIIPVPHAESAKAPRVAELMTTFCPGVSYKLMDEGKAHLAHRLEEIFNAEPMVVEERDKHNVLRKREIMHRFEAYPKLNKKIQEHHDNIFGIHRKSATKPNEAAAETKALVAFGYGAFKSHRQCD